MNKDTGIVVDFLPVTHHIVLSDPGLQDPDVISTSNAPVMQCVTLSSVEVQRRLMRYAALSCARKHILEQMSNLEMQVNALNAELDVYAYDLRNCIFIQE